MKKNSLTPNKGLSLSQAQSISNLCNQRAREIEAKLNNVNNFTKSVEIEQRNGGVVKHVIVVGNKLPDNVTELLIEKSGLHGCQAFLMENIKAKDALLNEIKRATPDVSSVEIPERPKTVSPLLNQLPVVSEDFGWSQLLTAEVCEYMEAEAFAAHIGQFIHEDSILDNLRKELPTIAPIEWMTIKDGEKSPVIVTVHHTSEELLKVHEELAALHRKYEQRVNYFKAKVKNLTTEENARIARINANAQNDAAKINHDNAVVFDSAMKIATEKVRSIQTEFENERQAKIKELAAMRISVDARFQKVVDIFLGQLTDRQE